MKTVKEATKMIAGRIVAANNNNNVEKTTRIFVMANFI